MFLLGVTLFFVNLESKNNNFSSYFFSKGAEIEEKETVL